MKYKIRYYIWLIMVLIMATMLLGCQSDPAYEYSFENPDIIAYVNGNAVYASQGEQYIEMKRSYYMAAVDESAKEDKTDENKNVPKERLAFIQNQNNETYEDILNVTIQRMSTAIGYSDEQWERDYYKTVIVQAQLNEYSDNDEKIQQSLDVSIDLAVQDAMNSGSDAALLFGTGINVNDVIKNVAEKYNLSHEDCVNTVYKEYVSSEIMFDYLKRIFSQNQYEGKVVEWNGQNTKEYAEYLHDLNVQFDAYLDGLLDQAEIVKRR